MCSIDRINPERRLTESRDVFLMELIHDQLPLAVPCYDLLPVTELTVGHDERVRRVFPAPLS